MGESSQGSPETEIQTQEGEEAPLIAWQPQAGPQTLAITCPFNDMLYGGARGGGKSDFLLGDFASHAARNPGKAEGILFRRSYKELEQLVKRSKKVYYKLGWRYRKGARTWIDPFGSTLKLRHLKNPSDAEAYQGHEYTWMGVDEVGNWAKPDPLNELSACLRSSEGVDVMLRVTANPGGKGHKWIKARYIDPAPPCTPIPTDIGWTRVFIPAKLEDNPILTNADPRYMIRLKGAGPAWLVKAWLHGDWDIQPDKEGALWDRDTLTENRVGFIPCDLVRAVVALDPSVTSKETSDECGIIVAGKGTDGHGYVMKDKSGRMSPNSWIRKALHQYGALKLDQIIGEANNGGDLIESLLRTKGQEGRNASYKSVWASRGKAVRAQPVASLYEEGKIHHVGDFAELEDEQCTWVPGEGTSPNRIDALVWAMTDLMLGSAGLRVRAGESDSEA